MPTLNPLPVRNVLFTILCDELTMLQVWKIQVPSGTVNKPVAIAWVLANTAIEAKQLSGCKNAIVERKPDHLWILPERVIWEGQSPL